MDWNSYTSNDLYDDIVNEFSSRFCVLDIQTAVKRIDSVLPCDNRQVLFLFISPDARSYMHYLEEWGYQNMLAILLQACSLSNRLRELCAPFVSSDNFDRLMKYFKSVQDKGFQCKWCEDGLAMDVPEPFTDIVMYPMSQLHSEIVNALKMFGEFVEAGLKDNIYQDFYSPSIFTQSSQKWVADHFGIVKTYDNIGV